MHIRDGDISNGDNLAADALRAAFFLDLQDKVDSDVNTVGLAPSGPISITASSSMVVIGLVE